MTSAARNEAGFLLWRIQNGEAIGMPASRPMPSVGPNCHELRVRDAAHNWRIMYRIDPDEIIVATLFAKRTEKTPRSEIERARRRLADYP
jgi:phage-related protein